MLDAFFNLLWWLMLLPLLLVLSVAITALIVGFVLVKDRVKMG